ncbi:spore germination protein [Scopulibacillus daqui]|uniref:Spore germination protein n=1 Tax=Scopulibacillus daqui TaxID=1469162 RepID=A0ABS2PZ40_9BACL|nr:spore germination protein [Scopulibacillus daqui]
MIRSALIVLLVFVVAGVGYWGYQEHREKNAVLIHAENDYQQAYHELAYYVDQLDNKLGTTLAMSSRDTMRPQLAEVWQLATMAHGAVGELPLTLMPFNKTNEYLSNLSRFSYQASIKNESNQPLSAQEYHQLEKLYKQSHKIETDLRNVQNKIMKNHLRWMDVEMALASQNEKKDNQIIDGLKTVDGKIGNFENKWGPEVEQMSASQEGRLNHLPGPRISKAQAVKRTKEFLHLNHSSTITAQKSGKGAYFDSYNMTIKNKKTGQNIVASVSSKGGYLIWFIDHRPVKYDRISLYKASKKAEQFLKQHGFKNMTLVKSDQYEHIGVFTLVKTVNNVRIYPATVNVKVAMDNGQIMAFDQTEYLINQKVNIDLKPKLSEKDALKTLNKNVKVQETHLVVYQNELGKNTLCYEFLGTKGRDTYRILINADNGQQEKTELLTD